MEFCRRSTNSSWPNNRKSIEFRSGSENDTRLWRRTYIVSASYGQEFEAMPETTFTFRVDQELKKAFTEAARANDRPGSQLLRDFMRDYVERAEHDAWFRAEVKQSLKEADDPNVELIPHEEVVQKWKARGAVLITPPCPSTRHELKRDRA
jgi:predicted transcriptional regulator